MMKAAILHKNGDPTESSVISVEDNIPKPVPGKGEILVRVKAAAINPVDWKWIQGSFPGKKSGLVGCDVAGVIDQIGPETSDQWKVGDEVYADAVATMGSFAEYCRVQAVAASTKPENLTFQQAAALPLAGLTALQGLTTYGGLKEGMSVAILGGSGGVGSLAVQIAKALGAAHVYATGSSVEMIHSLGADTVINYTETSVVDALKGKDLDIVYDTVGGYDNWQAAQAGLKKGGTFVTIAGDGGNSLLAMIPGIAWRKFMSLLGAGPKYNLFLTNTKPPAVVRDMKQLTELVESGKVKPILEERTFQLTTDSVHEMLKASMSHRAKGKLVLVVT